MIVNNYGGVRIDGTNATIIGNEPGEFVADRNNITRVWMDHAFWPFVTTKLYIDQTGDIDVLFDRTTYFKDYQSMRGTSHDKAWNTTYGNKQRTAGGQIYFGTILEHILIQNLCAFYDVGEHNEMKLHGADWNDALDMAWDKGESVAFTCAYAGNLLDIVKCLRNVEKISGINRIEVLEELKLLLADDEILYNCPDKKQELLMSYAKACENCTSGGTALVPIAAICENLEHKAEWMMKNIRENEWISDGTDGGWFNGYYDNNGRPVERCESGDVRMMLTGQVFAIMSGTAKKEQIKAICNSADKYLFDQKAGGYRLNTDFKEEKFDLGRMFGFAYGEKENGAVFSHMAVMYANALYKQGFIKEGYKVLKTLLDTAMDFDRSRMYPGVPEYFDNDGRGLYSYLTGAASWYMLTMITSVYGVHGELGDLVIEPALMPQQYNEKGDAKVSLEFAGHRFDISVHNPDKLEPGDAQVKRALCDDVKVENVTGNSVRIPRHAIEMLSTDKCHTVEIYIE